MTTATTTCPCYARGHIGQGLDFSTSLYLEHFSPVLPKLVCGLSFPFQQSFAKWSLADRVSSSLPVSI